MAAKAKTCWLIFLEHHSRKQYMYISSSLRLPSIGNDLSSGWTRINLMVVIKQTTSTEPRCKPAETIDWHCWNKKCFYVFCGEKLLWKIQELAAVEDWVPRLNVAHKNYATTCEESLIAILFGVFGSLCQLEIIYRATVESSLCGVWAKVLFYGRKESAKVAFEIEIVPVSWR